MTSTHPRRAAAQAEADAWLDLHADWAKGLPAEVRDTSVIGDATASGDGRSLPWYRFDGAFVGAPGPRDYQPRGLSGAECPRRITGDEPERTSTYEGPIHGTATEPVDYAALDHERRIVHDLPREELVEFRTPAMPLPAVELQVFPDTRRRAVRARAAEGTRQFSAATAVMGQPVPLSFQFRSCPIPGRTPSGDGFAYRRRAGRTQAFGDLSGHADTSWIEQLAAAEFIEWLRIEARCTDKELRALQQRAAGVSQTDRSGATLLRARRRALAALAS